MKIARLLLCTMLVAAVAAPAVGHTSGTLEAVPLSAPAPAWYTPALHAEVLASGAHGVALPYGVTVPTAAGIAFLGIRPGQFIIVGGGTLCSTNFVFRNGANYAIGTAGHCGNVGDQVTMLALPRVLFNIGTVTKSVNGGPGNDFALISINPALNKLVSPSMAFWGGPKGVHPPGVPLLVKHIGWGAGIGAGGTPRVGVGRTWSNGLWTFYGTIAPMDSGSGAIDGNWKAIGNITHILLDGGFIPPVFNAGTAMPRILAIAGLPLATCGPSPWPLYGCPKL